MEEQATQFWDEIRRNQAAVPQVDPHDIEACEALLESYYMQVLPHTHAPYQTLGLVAGLG